MVTNKEYLTGALVLAHSLKATKTTRKILCMVTSNLSDQDWHLLRAGGLEPVLVESIAAPSPSGIDQWDDVGYTKLNLWRLVDWDLLVYFDADCLVLESVDDLFLRFPPACRLT